jgi:LmbE family N-acetylglucosaminyl deacetylase
MTAARELQAAWSRLPLGGLTDIIGRGRCIVLAPHPDDESLGCGGLIAACVAAGRPPTVLILTDGTGSHPGSAAYLPDRLRALRQQEAISAVGALGLPADHVHFLDQKDTAAPTQGPSFDAVVAMILRITPPALTTAILAPWRHDPHCDHAAAALVAEHVTALRDLRLVSYPVWGWTLPPATEIEEQPRVGWRLDIARHLPAKRRAIGAHRSQYGGLITDDPTGFELPPNLLTVFDRPFETFLLP